MDGKIDFYEDINGFSENIIIKYNPTTTLNLQTFNNHEIINALLKWKTCFELFGKIIYFINTCSKNNLLFIK
jgi:hypothetical protein